MKQTQQSPLRETKSPVTAWVDESLSHYPQGAGIKKGGIKEKGDIQWN